MTTNETLRQIAVDLRQGVDELRGLVQTTQEYGIRNRHMIRVVAVSLVLDVLLTFGLGLNAVRTQQALDRAQRARTAQVAACAAANEVRRTDLKLWTFILAVPPKSGQESDPKVLEGFKKILGGFAEQNCSAIGGS